MDEKRMESGADRTLFADITPQLESLRNLRASVENTEGSVVSKEDFRSLLIIVTNSLEEIARKVDRQNRLN